MISVPPRRLLAPPIDDTLTSIGWPGCAKAGSSAVTITAAELRPCGATPGGSVTPSDCSIEFRLCAVTAVCSPVPSRPTTTP